MQSIAQRSAMFEEGRANGYLVKYANGDVWQWDRWQAGMGLVDFTNPGVVMGNLRWAIEQGIHVVVGTSGFTEERLAQVRGWLAEKPGVGVVIGR